ncbi:MAG: hypothetical protein NTX79_05120 [Candidatus Micrarchaeota archaeon]|nr:hypothetical protein [Candidatus Micrarchaeota archaeon]
MPNALKTEYLGEYAPKWKERFDKPGNSIQIRAVKKIRQILAGLPSEHARFGLPCFKENTDKNHRICYKSFEDRKIKCFYFVGGGDAE